MKGILSYQLVDPQLPNSEEGWFVVNEHGAYKINDISIKKIVSGRYSVSEGSEVVFELPANVLLDLALVKNIAVEATFNTPTPSTSLNEQQAIPVGAFIAVKLKTKFVFKAII